MNNEIVASLDFFCICFLTLICCKFYEHEEQLLFSGVVLLHLKTYKFLIVKISNCWVRKLLLRKLLQLQNFLMCFITCLVVSFERLKKNSFSRILFCFI